MPLVLCKLASAYFITETPYGVVHNSFLDSEGGADCSGPKAYLHIYMSRKKEMSQKDIVAPTEKVVFTTAPQSISTAHLEFYITIEKTPNE